MLSSSRRSKEFDKLRVQKMFYDHGTLSRIYDRTSGKCHLCGRKLALSNYAQFGRKGA
jgi:hypothetical protein